MSTGPGETERPISPRSDFVGGPAGQATPIRGEASLPQTAWTGPPTTPPVGRFARPVERYQIPEIEAEPVERSFPWRRAIGWLLATILVGVSAGWAYVRFVHDPRPDDDTVVTTSASAGPRIPRADTLVRQYLEALAAGDTATAMSLGAVGDGNPAAISPAAYARSLQTHPITEIRVPQLDNATTEVPASYRVGDQEVSTRFRVTRDDTGSWQLAHSTVQIELQVPNASGMPVLVNGVAIPSGVAEVLPGHYEVSTGLPLVGYPEHNSVLITNLEYDGRVQRVLTPVLTQAGRDAMLAAGRDALSACLGMASLAPPGCPNQVSNPAPYDPGSVRWELIGNPFGAANPALDPVDQTRGQVSMVLQFGVRFSYTDGSTNGYQALDPVSASYSGSLLVDTTQAVEVGWKSLAG